MLYIKKLTDTGMASTLYASPHIASAVYVAGELAHDELEHSITEFNVTPTKANKNIIIGKMETVVEWNNQYADLVIPIANNPAICATRQDAFTNILLSGLTPQKLEPESKGIPKIAVLAASNIGTGSIEVKVTNLKEVNAETIVYVAIAVPPVTDPPTPEAVIDVIDRQLVIKGLVMHMATISTTGKAASVIFSALISGAQYRIACYSMNGKKQVSKISAVITAIG